MSALEPVRYELRAVSLSVQSRENPADVDEAEVPVHSAQDPAKTLPASLPPRPAFLDKPRDAYVSPSDPSFMSAAAMSDRAIKATNGGIPERERRRSNGGGDNHPDARPTSSNRPHSIERTRHRHRSPPSPPPQRRHDRRENSPSGIRETSRSDNKDNFHRRYERSLSPHRARSRTPERRERRPDRDSYRGPDSGNGYRRPRSPPPSVPTINHRNHQGPDQLRRRRSSTPPRTRSRDERSRFRDHPNETNSYEDRPGGMLRQNDRSPPASASFRSQGGPQSTSFYPMCIQLVAPKCIYLCPRWTNRRRRFLFPWFHLDLCQMLT